MRMSPTQNEPFRRIGVYIGLTSNRRENNYFKGRNCRDFRVPKEKNSFGKKTLSNLVIFGTNVAEKDFREFKNKVCFPL